MDKKVLKAAADVMRELGLTEVSIKDAETEVTLKRELSVSTPAAETAATTATAAPACTPKADESDEGDIENSFASYTEVKAPLIGIFYDAPSPEAAPYIHVGDTVKKGDILCIIEAMKMMNEICAEADGTVVDICASSGALVEYGQTLFKIAEQE